MLLPYLIGCELRRHSAWRRGPGPNKELLGVCGESPATPRTLRAECAPTT